jgi:hypothetical protein
MDSRITRPTALGTPAGLRRIGQDDPASGWDPELVVPVRECYRWSLHCSFLARCPLSYRDTGPAPWGIRRCAQRHAEGAEALGLIGRGLSREKCCIPRGMRSGSVSARRSVRSPELDAQFDPRFRSGGPPTAQLVWSRMRTAPNPFPFGPLHFPALLPPRLGALGDRRQHRRVGRTRASACRSGAVQAVGGTLTAGSSSYRGRGDSESRQWIGARSDRVGDAGGSDHWVRRERSG